MKPFPSNRSIVFKTLMDTNLPYHAVKIIQSFTSNSPKLKHPNSLFSLEEYYMDFYEISSNFKTRHRYMYAGYIKNEFDYKIQQDE